MPQYLPLLATGQRPDSTNLYAATQQRQPDASTGLGRVDSKYGGFSGRRHSFRALPPRNLVSALCTDHYHRSAAFLVIAFSLPAIVTIALTTSGKQSSVAVVPFAKLTFGPLG